MSHTALSGFSLNPHSSFLLSLMLLENLTGGSFIWTRPSKTKLPLAVDDQMKYSRVELSSVKDCTNHNACTHSFSLNKGRSKSSRFKLIWVFKPHRSSLNKHPSATSKDGHALLPILPLLVWKSQKMLKFCEQILILIVDLKESVTRF